MVVGTYISVPLSSSRTPKNYRQFSGPVEKIAHLFVIGVTFNDLRHAPRTELHLISDQEKSGEILFLNIIPELFELLTSESLTYLGKVSG